MTKRFTDQNAATLDCAAKLVVDKDGELLCSLAAAGRTSEGDPRAMVLAAHKMGYRTNFDKKGEPIQ